jgi:hypothetical protein
VGYKLKKNLLSAAMDVWRRGVMTSKILKLRKELIREKWE